MKRCVRLHMGEIETVPLKLILNFATDIWLSLLVVLILVLVLRTAVYVRMLQTNVRNCGFIHDHMPTVVHVYYMTTSTTTCKLILYDMNTWPTQTMHAWTPSLSKKPALWSDYSFTETTAFTLVTESTNRPADTAQQNQQGVTLRVIVVQYDI